MRIVIPPMLRYSQCGFIGKEEMISCLRESKNIGSQLLR